MVYAAAYCPKSFQGELEELGFDGQLSLIAVSEKWKADLSCILQTPRRCLWTLEIDFGHVKCSRLKQSELIYVVHSLQNAFTDYPTLCYSANIISPQGISKHMLKKVPFNLNRQAEVRTCRSI